MTGNDQLEGIRVTNRSYGRYLDADLDRATNLVTEVASSTSAVRMLAGNRADYLIEYPTVISQTLGTEAERLRFVTISDTSPFLEASISCTPSAQGQAFIDAVDRPVAQPDHRPGLPGPDTATGAGATTAPVDAGLHPPGAGGRALSYHIRSSGMGKSL